MQWEFAGLPGPPAGRYLVRRLAGEPASHVLVIESAEAAPRRRLRRRSRHARPVTRATVICAGALSERAAHEWLRGAHGERAESLVQSALAVLDHALHAHRIAAADPHATGLPPAAAGVTRLGYGTGDQVAHGRWTHARELRAPRVRRPSALAPEERLAALLAGRDAALACEELTLRARLDADQGREREAALQLRAALQAALAELAGWREAAGMAARLDELRTLWPGVERAAGAALEGGLAPEESERIRTALARLEAALRARSAAQQAPDPV